TGPREPVRGPAVLAWDFLFYVSFGVVVTSSVTTAGVLVVFSFLIVPAVIGSLFATAIASVLAIAWGAGITASGAALVGSYILDLPTGAAIVTALGAALALSGAIKAWCSGEPERRHARRRIAWRMSLGTTLVMLLASGLWLVARPAADQPLFTLVERAVGGPTRFLDANDRDTFLAAQRDATRFIAEVERLNRMER